MTKQQSRIDGVFKKFAVVLLTLLFVVFAMPLGCATATTRTAATVIKAAFP